MARRFFFLCICLGFFSLNGEYPSLFQDLETVSYWDEKVCERLPVTFNHLLQTGYFTTPSARMGEAGEIGFGFVDVPPYWHLNLRFQPFSHIDLTFNYRVFRGVDDPGMGKRGFGDFADRGANIKVAIFTPEDTDNVLPGIALGLEDFMGTRRFRNYYIVGTKVWMDQALETSLGWGAGRFGNNSRSRGFFGGVAWFPFNYWSSPWLQGLSFAGEYDPIDYTDCHNQPHPEGRVSNFPINFGAKYQISYFDFAASYIRGDDWAFSGAITYNWGSTTGFLPKIKDPIPYGAPFDTEPIGCYRPESVLVQNLNYAFDAQGFLLKWASMECNPEKGNVLWLGVVNMRYRREFWVRERIQYLLAALTPSNIAEVVVVLESLGVPCQEYRYPAPLLERFANRAINPCELEILTSMGDVNYPDDCLRELYYRTYDLWQWRISPRYEAFFGSSQGKFKYDAGIRTDLEGFMLFDIFYELELSYTVLSTIDNLHDFDFYNPSQLPNVWTDYINYRKRKTFSTDKAYLQKSWNLGRGFFGRLTTGYFQVNYAGLAGEILWYPANWNLALGLDGAILKKRNYNGLGFQSKIRRLEGFTPVFRPYTILDQFFLDVYYDIPAWQVFAKVSVGSFLAKDKGGRFELTRYFDSGFRVTAWITVTNANDQMHGERYFDRGIAIELPLDIFYKCHSRRVWNYGLAAWLRDAGARTTTGKNLFDIINLERRW